VRERRDTGGELSFERVGQGRERKNIFVGFFLFVSTQDSTT